MSTPADQVQQDIDSGTGQVVTPGEPAKHRDILDGQSAGHHIEPEHTEGSRGNEPPPPATGAPPTADDIPPAEPPPKTSREEIYAKARTTQDAEIADTLEEMTPAQRMHYDRMVAEAGGGPDPFAPAEEPAATPGQPSLPGEIPRQGIDTPGETTTITIYGMHEEVPTADIEAAGGISAYQKGRAADVRLERLATYEASLRNWEQQLSQSAQQPAAETPAQAGATGITEPSPTDVPGSTVDIGALSQVMTDAIYSGDREETAARFTETLTTIQADAIRAAQAAVPTQAQPSTQDQQAAAAETQARAEANTVFSQEFGDLDTPVLRQAALNMVQEVAADPVMIGRPLAEITREACGRIREDVYGTREPPPGYTPAPVATGLPPALHTAPVTPPGQDLAGRHALKRRTVVTPLTEATGRAPAPASTEKQFPNNSEFVTKLRQGRGQPT